MRALVTNDDGISSPGLLALVRGALAAGLEVTVAAPHTDASGVGTSVSAVIEDRQVRVHPQTLPGLPDVPAFSVEAHPAFIVHAAGQGWFEPRPELVLSGTNIGANVGRAVLHSGTVGAALTGSMHRLPALATSLDCPPDAAGARWDAVLAVLPEALKLLLARDQGTVLSLNVPNLAPEDLGPLREAALAPFGQVAVRVEHRPGTPGSLRTTLVAPDEEPEPGTDVALLAAGHPTITALRSVAAVPLG